MSIEAMKYCAVCQGRGEVDTGINESPVTVCNACNGTGMRQSIEQAEQAVNDGPINEGWQLSVSHGHLGYGVYAHMIEYPEEGAVFLFSVGAPDTAPPRQPEQADQGQSCYCPNCEALSKELAALKAEQAKPVATNKVYVTREQLAELYPPPRQPLTDELVTAAARALNDRQAKACGVNKDDHWYLYGDDIKEDARVVLEAAHGITKENT